MWYCKVIVKNQVPRIEFGGDVRIGVSPCRHCTCEGGVRIIQCPTAVSNCCTANLLMSSDTDTRTFVHCIRGSGASAVRNQAVRFSIEF